MYFKIDKLEIDDIYKIQKFHIDNKKQLRISILAFFQWNSYGYNIYYHFDGENYFFLLKITKEIQTFFNFLNTSDYTGYIILAKEFITKDYIDKMKTILCNKSCETFIFSEELDNDVLESSKLVNFHDLKEYVVNYVYKTNQFIGFPGKKMQKKRNHFNNFKKNNPDYKISKISSMNSNLAKEFVTKNTSGEIEFNSYTHIFDRLDEFSEFIRGSILEVNGKVIGVTIGIINGNTYEILIEKGEKNIIGTYQALISENLVINNITVEFIDRQDDNDMENLQKSKDSYKPINKIFLEAYKNQC